MIILIIFLITSTAAILSFYVITPKFKATTILMINQTPNRRLKKMDYSDVLMFQQLVKTYAEIAKSQSVSEKVAVNLPFKISPQQIQAIVTVMPSIDTQLISISVINEDANKAAKIANVLTVVFKEKINLITKTENIQVIDMARIPVSPIKPNLKLNISIGLFLGIFFSFGLALILEYLDNTLKTESDIEMYLNIPVIGMIPKLK